MKRSCAAQLTVSNNLNFKTQLISYGGMGYRNVAEEVFPKLLAAYGGETFRMITGGNVARILAWWKEKPKVQIKLKMWKCKWCSKDFVETLENYSKADFIYCSMDCLRAHTRAGLK